MKKRLLFTTILAMSTFVSHANVTVNLNRFSNTDLASPNLIKEFSADGWISTDGGATKNPTAVYDVSTFIADNAPSPQLLGYTITGLDLDGTGGANDQLVIYFTVTSDGQILRTIWTGSEPKNSGWLSSSEPTLNADDEYIQFDFRSLSVDLNGGINNAKGRFDGFCEVEIGGSQERSVVIVNGVPRKVEKGQRNYIDLTQDGLDSNLQVLFKEALGALGAWRPQSWSFQVTISSTPTPSSLGVIF